MKCREWGRGYRLTAVQVISHSLTLLNLKVYGSVQKPLHWTIRWGSWIQLISSYKIFLRSILISPSVPHVDFLNSLLLLHILTQFLFRKWPQPGLTLNSELVRIRDIPGSDTSTQTGKPGWGHSWFFPVAAGKQITNSLIILQAGLHSDTKVIISAAVNTDSIIKVQVL